MRHRSSMTRPDAGGAARARCAPGRRRPRLPFGPSSGFTIAEVLVAILITSIVAGVIYASYRGALQIIYASQEDMEQTTMARLMLDRISGDFSCAFLRGGKEYLVFVGDDGGDAPGADSVTFIAATHLRSERDARESVLSEVAYSLDPEGYLLRREDPSLDEDPFSGGETRAIGEGVAGFDLEYLGDGGWVASWDSRVDDSLPRAVRVTLTMATGREGGGEAGEEAVRLSTFRTETSIPLGGSWEEEEEPTPTPAPGTTLTPTPRPD
ncbi:MAG TPA: type II secretion system protein GspJ [bacterium]|nr:type II secretion system protein GspJ [bacterium]